MEEKTINKKQTFMAGVLTIMIAQIIIKVLGLLYRLVITNVPYFGDEGNGLYGAGFQIYMLLLSVASIGVPGAISKLVSERIALNKYKEAHRIFKIAFSLFAITGIVGSGILFFGARYIATEMIGNANIEGVLVALSPSIFFVAISAVIRGYFNGMYNMKATSNSQTIEQFFKSLFTILIVLGVYFIFKNPTLIANVFSITEENVTAVMAAGANLASTIATAIGFVYLYFFYSRRKKEIWKNIRENDSGESRKLSTAKTIKMILFLSIPMSLASIVSALNRNIDTFTVINGLKESLAISFSNPELIESEATRLYGILSGKIDMLIGLPLSLNIAFATALVPAVSEAMAKEDKKTANRRISFSIRTTLLIGFPCAIGLAVLSAPILNLLFPGAPAVEAPLLLSISAFTIIFTVLNQTLGGALQGLGKIFVPAIALACGAVIKLILNLTLIPNPMFGVNGAAIGSVVCHIIAMVINLLILTKTMKKKEMKLNVNFIQVLKPIIATIVMGIVAYYSQIILMTLIGRPSVATIISIAVAVISYIIMILSLKVFSREDYHTLPYGDKLYSFLRKVNLVKGE